MSTTEQTARPSAGAEGAPCASCGSPLAPDQRYCLECGARRGPVRVPYERYLRSAEPAPAAPPTAGAGTSNEVSPLGAILGVALLGGMLLIGVLLGRGENDEPAAPATVLQAGEPAATPTAPAAPTTPESGGAVTSEWPAGTDGFTIELGTLPKEDTTSADVEATKADLEGRGASEPGVLDSDLYPSLPSGNYVVYSGVYDTKADAKAALPGLVASFPDAKVIKVSQKTPTSGGGASSEEPKGTDAAEEPATSGDAADIADEAAAALDQLEEAASGTDRGAPPAAEETPVPKDRRPDAEDGR